MTVRDLIKILAEMNQNATILTSSDGEGNQYNDIHQVTQENMDDNNPLYIIWPGKSIDI